MTIPAFPPGQNSASTPCFRSFPASSTYLSDPGPESRISESSAGNPRDFSARTIAFRRISVLPVPAEPWTMQPIFRQPRSYRWSIAMRMPCSSSERTKYTPAGLPVPSRSMRTSGTGNRSGQSRKSAGSAPIATAAQNWMLSSRSRLLTGRISSRKLRRGSSCVSAIRIMSTQLCTG